ncbi:metallophosphoesterase family protein [Paludisphaera soli]|uniref:metallophosphoesterase family protein n=1 Tax=Paludisphaera soli TaxID=2712865 RepID=UPI0013EA1965|nr:metallophosphoesterase [Paludisphaera soli]
MPIHLPPTSRRSFLGGVAFGGAAMILPHPRRRAEADEPDRGGDYLALLADTHISHDPGMVVGEAYNPSDNLRAAVVDVLSRPRPPVAVVVAGDLAIKDGREGDYRQFLSLVQPLRDRGVPVHLILGNHDDRENFRKVVADPGAARPGTVEDRCVGVVEAAGMRLVLLDSLDVVNLAPGLLGDPQRAWLAKALDAEPDAATLVLVHHNPAADSLASLKALADTDLLMEILRPRKQVKALVFGHTHAWRRGLDDGLHLVNLPAVAYPFDEPQPLGWCRLESHQDGRGATIELRCIGGDRSKHGERAELAWRGA